MYSYWHNIVVLSIMDNVDVEQPSAALHQPPSAHMLAQVMLPKSAVEATWFQSTLTLPIPPWILPMPTLVTWHWVATMKSLDVLCHYPKMIWAQVDRSPRSYVSHDALQSELLTRKYLRNHVYDVEAHYNSGVENGNECYCGGILGPNSNPADTGNCNTPCVGPNTSNE